MQQISTPTAIKIVWEVIAAEILLPTKVAPII